MTALLDPDMFPIQDLRLKLHIDHPVSVWNDSNQKVRNQVGFELIVAPSSIDHIEAGNGVFLKTVEPNKRLVILLILTIVSPPALC